MSGLRRRCGAAGRRGQALVWFALFLPGVLWGLLLLWDYVLLTRDVLMTSAALDLAVHAGAQQAWVDARGRVSAQVGAGEAEVRRVFAADNRVGAELLGAWCGGSPPVCRAQARVYSRGLGGIRWGVVVEAEGRGTPGVARGGD